MNISDRSELAEDVRAHELLREARDFIIDQYGPGLGISPASEAYLLVGRIKAHLGE